MEDRDKKNALDNAIDDIRDRYGKYAVMRGVFLDGEFKAITGGVGAEDYPSMSTIL